MLRRSVAELLGIELATGRRIEVTSVGGGRTVAYVHELQTRFASNIAYAVPFAIAESEQVPNLLGRLHVFDWLQVDFDGTFQETRIAAPWLDDEQRRIWDFLMETSNHILSRWPETDLPEPAGTAAARFINRAGQVVASARALLKMQACYAAPALIRTLFELAMQFEYLMDDPGPRSEQYLEFTHITRYKQISAIAKNPTGRISQQLARSPLRAEGEKRNKMEYERVLPRFRRKGTSVWDKWYCMSTRDLAEKVGWGGEYRFVFALTSAWAHGDPSSTEQVTSDPFTKPDIVFNLCLQYYARMLLKLADTTKIVLTSEQYKGLKAFTTQFS